MKGHWLSLCVTAVVASTALMGCSQEVDVPEQDVAATSQEILDGAPALRHKYDAVGALVFYDPDFGVLDTFCSGALVGRKSVVTARHCTEHIDLAQEFGLMTAVAFGPDAFAPTAVVPITDYVAAPPGPGKNNGLLQNGGRDVAVVHLEAAPKGIKPAKLGEFTDRMVGKRFEIAGYGINSDGFYGQRYAGQATVRADKGRWYELLFHKDYDAYLEWYFTDAPTASGSEAEAKDWWKKYKLENKYEALVGGLPGEAVACHGDSGGPLLGGSCGDTMTVYGVHFAVENTISSICGLGSGYLVFNRKMLDFVKHNVK